MPMLRTLRLVGLAFAAAALLIGVALWSGLTPAGASMNRTFCLLLCPPTTVATTPPTTTAPAATTTTSVAKTHSTTTTAAPAPTRTTTTTTTTTASQPSQTRQRTPGVASVGAAGLAPPAAGAGDPSAFGLGTDPAAPQLAGTPAPSTTVIPTPVPALPALSGLVGTAKGLPDDHAALRLFLSILVLFVAGLAAAQLPASRRAPRPGRDPLE